MTLETHHNIINNRNNIINKVENYQIKVTIVVIKRMRKSRTVERRKLIAFSKLDKNRK